MTAYQRLPTAAFRPVPDIDVSPQSPDSRACATYDLAWIHPRGQAIWDRRLLPDTPEVEAAVSCLARGAMLRGPRGPVAVEDLLPGDHVVVRGGRLAQIDWIGSRSYAPGAARPLLYRVAAHAFGASGPHADILLGASARVLIDSPRCRDLVGDTLAFAPVSAFEDGRTVSAVAPPGEVTVYGIACRGQEAVMAGGLGVESAHPGRATARSLTPAVVTDMARLFPQAAAGAGFGAPRIASLTRSEAAELAMAGV